MIQRRTFLQTLAAPAIFTANTRARPNITYVGDPAEQLYDMQSDPGETRNLASSHSSVLSEHRNLLQSWEARLEEAPGNPNAEWWRTL